jgi:hypothetical protein
VYSLPGSDFNDVSGQGYDTVTGRGSPVADQLVADLSQQPATQPVGPHALIPSDSLTGGQGNHDLGVPEGSNPVHDYRDNVSGQGVQGLTTPANPTGPGSVMRSDFGTEGFHHFEVVVPEDGNLVQYDWDDVSL